MRNGLLEELSFRIFRAGIPVKGFRSGVPTGMRNEPSGKRALKVDGGTESRLAVRAVVGNHGHWSATCSW